MTDTARTDAGDLLSKSAFSWAADIKNPDALLAANKDQLFMMLAVRTIDPQEAVGTVSDRFGSKLVLNTLQRGPAVIELGKRVFRRCAKAFHDFLCSSNDDDAELRDKIKNAILSPDVSATTIVAGGLVAALGLSAPVALVVATLINQIVVAPTIEELCASWDLQIDSATTTA